MGGMMGNMNNLHVFHVNAVTNFRCNLCHIAVPHGWKNKVLLVNLNDVGPESTQGRSGEVRTAQIDGLVNEQTGGGQVVSPYFDGPYYNRAAGKIINFVISGGWTPGNCGSTGENGGNGVPGVAWMVGGGMGGGGMGGGGGGGGGDSEACDNLP